jgi:hypothetical protein
MESILWALNLVGVCLLCLWALKQDDLETLPGETPEQDTARARSGQRRPQRTAASRRQPLQRK